MVGVVGTGGLVLLHLQVLHPLLLTLYPRLPQSLLHLNTGHPVGGVVGVVGVVGSPGVVGVVGTDGTDGVVGSPGTDGTEGVVGVVGTEGTDGTDGSPGVVGVVGVVGTVGVVGNSGFVSRSHSANFLMVVITSSSIICLLLQRCGMTIRKRRAIRKIR